MEENSEKKSENMIFFSKVSFTTLVWPRSDLQQKFERNARNRL